MKTKKQITRALNGILVLIILLFLLDTMTSFEIKNQWIRSFTYFGILIITPLTLIWNLIISKTLKNKIMMSILPSLVLIGVLILGPLNIILSFSSWKTQTIVYENTRHHSKKVEFQMKDIGAQGYNKRTVEVCYLTHLFMITKPVKKDIVKSAEWIKVDKNINELGLKFP